MTRSKPGKQGPGKQGPGKQGPDKIAAGLACPTCGEPAAPPAAPGGKSPRPFCSRRCADIDLGRWFQERYAIPAVDAADDSIVESLVGPEGRANGGDTDQG